MSSTLVFDESGEPLHVQQRKQIDAYRAAWKEAGHAREPRVSVSRLAVVVLRVFALPHERRIARGACCASVISRTRFS